MKSWDAQDGAELWGYCRAHKINRKTLATHLETDESTLSKIFTGKQEPQTLFLVELGKALEAIKPA